VSDPSVEDLTRYIQGGSVAAYRNCAQIKLHYMLQKKIEECVQNLEKRNMKKKNITLEEISEDNEGTQFKFVEKTKKNSGSFKRREQGSSLFSPDTASSMYVTSGIFKPIQW